MARTRKSHKDYWNDRNTQLFDAQDTRNEKFYQNLQKEYERTAERIDKEVATYYQKYGRENIIEYRDLLETLSTSEMNLLFRDFEEFMQRYPEYQRLIPVSMSIYQLNRLEGMQLSIQKHMVELGTLEEEIYEAHLEEAYEKGYLSTMKALENPGTFFEADKIIMAQTINAAWTNGENFSDRLWLNKKLLVSTINNEIRDGLIRGDDYETMSKLLKQKMDKKGMYEARRLVATESAFVLNQANKQAFMDEGIERYEFVAVLDGKTSEKCSSLDGQIFRFEEAVPGLNYGPMHPWCRSTSVPIEND